MFQSSVSPGHAVSEDWLFEREWAETRIGTVFQRLTDEFAAGCKGELFHALKAFVRGGAEPLPSYDQLAARLGMPEATVRSHVNRLRTPYRALLRAELLQTVETEAQVDEELGHPPVGRAL